MEGSGRIGGAVTVCLAPGPPLSPAETAAASPAAGAVSRLARLVPPAATSAATPIAEAAAAVEAVAVPGPRGGLASDGPSSSERLFGVTGARRPLDAKAMESGFTACGRRTARTSTPKMRNRDPSFSNPAVSPLARHIAISAHTGRGVVRQPRCSEALPAAGKIASEDCSAVLEAVGPPRIRHTTARASADEAAAPKGCFRATARRSAERRRSLDEDMLDDVSGTGVAAKPATTPGLC